MARCELRNGCANYKSQFPKYGSHQIPHKIAKVQITLSFPCIGLFVYDFVRSAPTRLAQPTFSPAGRLGSPVLDCGKPLAYSWRHPVNNRNSVRGSFGSIVRSETTRDLRIGPDTPIAIARQIVQSDCGTV